MPDENTPNLIDLNPAHGIFPLPELLESGQWKALAANAKAVLGPLWTLPPPVPEGVSAEPNRQTLAAEAGVCSPGLGQPPRRRKQVANSSRRVIRG